MIRVQIVVAVVATIENLQSRIKGLHVRIENLPEQQQLQRVTLPLLPRVVRIQTVVVVIGKRKLQQLPEVTRITRIAKVVAVAFVIIQAETLNPLHRALPVLPLHGAAEDLLLAHRADNKIK